ncbi:MAG: MBL fold metallo-hydrolase [Halovenus sp.]
MRQLAVVLAAVVLLGFAGCAGVVEDSPGDQPGTGDAVTDASPPATAVEGQLTLYHIDVGQADATLLVTPTGETVLIDTGDWRQDGDVVIDYLERLGIERIDHLVATHPHADHIGGHAAVIEHFETERDGIGAAYDSGVAHDTATYERYLDAIEEHDVDLLLVEEGDRLPLADDNVSALVLNPPADDAGEDFHRNSVALAVAFGEFQYLTTGDAERGTEERLLEDWPAALDADVYQAGHHGSSSSSTAAFVDAVDPQLAIISSNRDSQYGHPHDEVLATFANRDIETYWTGVHGNVVVTTDGDDIDVTTAEAFPTDPDEMFDAKGAPSSLLPVAHPIQPGTHVARAPTTD